jgi:hypothetical protein
MKPQKVSEGSKINILCKIINSDTENRRHFYGSQGYQHDIETMPDQDYDFDMERSDFNQNSTGPDFG